jgi:hypothetical protein
MQMSDSDRSQQFFPYLHYRAENGHESNPDWRFIADQQEEFYPILSAE